MRKILFVLVVASFAISSSWAKPSKAESRALEEMAHNQEELASRLKRYDQALEILQKQQDEKNNQAAEVKPTALSDVTSTLTPTPVEPPQEQVIPLPVKVKKTLAEATVVKSDPLYDYLFLGGVIISVLLLLFFITDRKPKKPKKIVSKQAIDAISKKMETVIRFKTQGLPALVKEDLLLDNPFGRWILSCEDDDDLNQIEEALLTQFQGTEELLAIGSIVFRQSIRYVLSTTPSKHI